ncbi:MAG: ribonuclease HI [Proteobacteria bacterium]|nr:ribonuclease HI [Pseudomonadota bacterium]
MARCDQQGRLVAERGRVEVRYTRQASRAYFAAQQNLTPTPGVAPLPDDACASVSALPPGASRGGKRIAPKQPPRHADSPSLMPADGRSDDPIVAYTDGACSGNPGPAGLGVVLLDGGARHELSEYLGRATNNVAELSAIVRAVQAVAGSRRPVRIYTDSRYAIGVLTKGWRAKANITLIARAKAELERLPDVRLLHVPGHVGVELNERADELARRAVDGGASEGWTAVPKPDPSPQLA